MTAPLTPLVARLPATVPFVGPEKQERDRGRPFAARIGANESVFGPSPLVVEAMRRASPEMWMYCDPNNHDLREKLAAQHKVPPESIVIGEGIDGLLGYTVRLFVKPGVKVVTSAGAYPTFNYHVAGFGGELVTVPYRDDAEDPDALAEAVRTSRARLCYISNPDNPMGTWHDGDRIKQLIAAMPKQCLLCLDEAYIEFAPEDATPAWDPYDTRVIRYRTFSKAHGMAGMRIAYAITAPEIAAANGLSCLPSATNFVAVDCGGDGDFARQVLAGLLARDIFVRMPGVAPLDRCIRISAGRTRELELLAAALPEALAEARS